MTRTLLALAALLLSPAAAAAPQDCFLLDGHIRAPDLPLTVVEGVVTGHTGPDGELEGELDLMAGAEILTSTDIFLNRLGPGLWTFVMSTPQEVRYGQCWVFSGVMSCESEKGSGSAPFQLEADIFSCD